MSQNATLKLEGQDNLELPVLSGTLGPDVIDIRKLYAGTDMFTFDPGFTSTASCESKITFIDGDKGQLYYRGYPIEQLAESSDYLETCYLLLNGELPNAQEKQEFETTILRHNMVHEQLTWFFRGFRRDAHPMAMMVGVVGALAAFYQDSLDISDPDHRRIAEYRMIAKIPTIAAMCYRYSNGLPFNYPKNNLSYTANFMHMMFATPCEPYEPNPVLVRALDRIFILHADHEQNCSTSTVRMVGSAHTGLFASISAGVSALWGPLHGGANQAVIEMLDYAGIDLTGKRVTVVGRSLVIGKPVAMMLMKKNATVTVCHTKTKDMAGTCRNAEVLVAAAGSAKMIKPDYVADDAVVIDVGINVDESGNLCGDVDFDNVAQKTSVITPVPGGVGSVTTSVLAKHLLRAAKMRKL